MNTQIRILLLAFAMALCTSSYAQEMFIPAHPAPKREVRGVWITTLGGLDWPKTKASSPQGIEQQKQELTEMLDQLQACHINTIFLQTRVRGSVIYPSQIEPWDVALTGQYNRSPGYDPLAFAIEEAHQRGMELHAWVVTIPCFKVAQAKRIGRKSLAYTHPSWLRKHADTYYLDPGLPGVSGYIADICQEIAENYDVDGIHFDYIRYPENPETFPDAATYKKYGKGMNKREWRCNNITTIAREAYQRVKAIKPWIRMSCSPVGKYQDVSRYSAKGWAALTTVYQDAQGWMRQGIMDMLCPMMYFQGNHFYPFAADWQEQSSGRIIAPGLGIYFMSPREKDWEMSIIQRELCYVRQQELGGQAFFRCKFLTENTKGILDYLRDDFYPYPALTPAMTWLCDTPPQAPQIKAQQRVDGVRELITWNQVKGQHGESCRYVIYADKNTPVDITNPANIVTTTDSNEYNYNLLSRTLYGLHMAITAIDRFGNESAPTQF